MNLPDSRRALGRQRQQLQEQMKLLRESGSIVGPDHPLARKAKELWIQLSQRKAGRRGARINASS